MSKNKRGEVEKMRPERWRDIEWKKGERELERGRKEREIEMKNDNKT